MLRTIFVFNVAVWKRPLLKNIFKRDFLIFISLDSKIYNKKKRILLTPNKLFLVWGKKQPKDLQRFSDEFKIPIWRIEDGFIRSVGLGAERTMPCSFCIDKKGIYFDSSCESDLENILNNFDSYKNTLNISKAKKYIEIIKNNGISKYNEAESISVDYFYGDKNRKRILVLGQVEDDHSIIYGGEVAYSNADLVQIAINENQGCQIIFKPHPDYLSGSRKEISSLHAIEGDFITMPVPIPLSSALHEVDRVYTLSSLGGFEALIHGCSVTCIGAPFYSGWGLTEDRVKIKRRNKILSLEEVFVGSYMLYPEYFDPKKGNSMTLGKVIENIQEEINNKRVLSNHDFFMHGYYYNFATKSDLDPNYYIKSPATKIAIITDDESSIKIARALALIGKKVSVFTALENTARSPYMGLSSSELNNIQVASLAKYYGNPFSDIEKKSVSMSKAIADKFRVTLSDIGFLSDEAVDAFVLDFEDNIYHEAIRFMALESVVSDFDSIIMMFESPENRHDVYHSLLHHAEQNDCLGKVNCHHSKRIGFKKIEDSFVVDNSFIPQNDLLDISIKYIYRDVLLRPRKSISIDNAVGVVGSISKDNYGYLPIALRLIKLARARAKVVYFQSNLGSAKVYDEVKGVLLSEGLLDSVTIYNGESKNFNQEYTLDQDRVANVSSGIYYSVISSAIEVLPREVVNVFKGRFSSYAKQFVNKIVYAAELEYMSERLQLILTSQDRSLASNILVANANRLNVNSVSLQPQIISKSPRYRLPKVKKMGVIDTTQKDIYKSFGGREDSMSLIGSINISERLYRLRENKNKFCTDLDIVKTKRVFFAMQHSTEKEMCLIAESFRQVLGEQDMHLYVKPHPHQEKTVLNKISTILSGFPNAEFISPSADTYEYMSKSDLIVGLFSSVLYEAALFNKDVLVVDYLALDNSVDISVKGLAVKVKGVDSFTDFFTSFCSGGDDFSAIEVSRKEYLKENSQFLESDLYSPFDQFVNSNLS